MKDNIYENIFEKADILLNKALERIAKDFKSAKPFQKELMSDKDRLTEYYEVLPELDNLRPQMGDEAVDGYIAQMQDLERRQAYA